MSSVARCREPLMRRQSANTREECARYSCSNAASSPDEARRASIRSPSRSSGTSSSLAVIYLIKTPLDRETRNRPNRTFFEHNILGIARLLEFCAAEHKIGRMIDEMDRRILSLL